MKEVLAAIQAESDVEALRTLNKAVVERIRQISGLKRYEFRVGQRVSFVTKGGARVYGKVTKINPKNIKVVAEAKPGMIPTNWTVSPSLLSAA